MSLSDITLAREYASGRPERRTFTSSMETLTSFLREDSMFAGVEFLESYADDLLSVPRVTWKLRSRIAGNNGVNRKNPFLIEQIQLADGRILNKKIFPQTYEVAFETYGATPNESDSLRDNLEFWLMTHRPQAAQSGIESIIFLSEQEPNVISIGSSQKIHKRTLLYHGIINYLYPNIDDPIQAIESSRLNGGGGDTVSVVRSSGDSDLSPIAGPLALQFLHSNKALPQEDYVQGIDYVVIVDREKFEAFFQIRWLPKGKQPVVGVQYFMTYVKSVPTQTIVNSGYTLPVGGRVRRVNPVFVSKILGSPVDETLQSQTIITQTSGRSIAPTSNSLREALERAQSDLVVVVDPPQA